MELRREPRFKPNQAANLKASGAVPRPIDRVIVLDVSGSGMRLQSNLPVACGTSVEVDIGHTVARGAVCRCEPMDDFYEVGIEVATIETKSAPV